MTKRIALIIFTLLSLFSTAAAQDNRFILNLPNVDKNRWRFGFTLGFNMSDFTTLSSEWQDEDGNKYYSASAGLSPQFNVGAIVDLRIVEYLNIRFTPALSLGNRNLNYTCFNKDGEQVGETKLIAAQTTTIDLPFYIKYSAKRYGNFRPYVLVGGGPQFNLNMNPEEPLLLLPFDVQIAFGVGFEFYTQYFKFCPEIRFGFGLMNQLNQDHPEIEGTVNEPYTRSVEKLTSRVLTICFNFE